MMMLATIMSIFTREGHAVTAKADNAQIFVLCAYHADMRIGKIYPHGNQAANAAGSRTLVGKMYIVCTFSVPITETTHRKWNKSQRLLVGSPRLREADT